MRILPSVTMARDYIDSSQGVDSSREVEGENEKEERRGRGESKKGGHQE